ncbi:RNA 2',3'-cyclic phosphodiesterase [Caballeronia sp. LZ016]|uniref:RNA 2',3'-cyclic phosphodiesterase n=1 Tax=Caballeronia sp. LZ016 TaxID=3038554 RepID=UPI0028637B65|nr:RNA 2',3'-cyclic phosphodiesterase [Caballeronia sp. LZ016]MDR5738552.1 RNA 2',3'-cyclic phosphodiesterase [Caballeronia sp. LZ016]
MSTPRPTDSLFLAIHPDASAASRIHDEAARLRIEHRLRATPIAADRLHITLHYLGAFAGLPADVIDQARVAASSVAAPPFDLALDRIETFSSRRPRRPLVIAGNPNEAFSFFVDRLGNALQAAGITVRSHPQFIPHVTLLYTEQRIARQTIEPIEWTVRGFSLVRSLLGRSQHEILARWPLAS